MKLLSFRYDKTCNGCVYYHAKSFKCYKFLTLNDSLTVDFEDALICRLDKSLCGVQAKYFMETQLDFDEHPEDTD